jgi:biopolymer transport protein ExbD/biopolymer transport protein TolR
MGMDLGQKRATPGRAQPNMNVTPLVDVVLVLLIIFMVIAPLLAKQFWLSLPNKVEKDQPRELSDKDLSVVVIATKAGEIKINHDAVAKSEFSNKLHRVLAAREQRTIFFDAEDDADFGNAVEILDMARAAGATTIAVLTDPIASGR